MLTPNRTSIDAAACAHLLRKTAEEGYELLEDMSSSSYHPQSERQRRSARVHQISVLSAVSAQLEVMNRKLDDFNMSGSAMRFQEIFCEKCGGEHDVHDWQDDNPLYMPERAPVNQVWIETILGMILIRTIIILDGEITPCGGQNNQNRLEEGIWKETDV